MRFDKEITGQITRVGLDRFPIGGEPPQTAGHKAAVLAEPGATALASPENLPELGANSSQSGVFGLLGLAGSPTNSGDFSRSPEVCHHPRIVGVSRSDIGAVFAV